MINKIKCFFGFHDFGNWRFHGFTPKSEISINKRTCKRCGHEETLRLRRGK